MRKPAALAVALFAVALLNMGPAAAQDRPELTIYTYESFTAEWGPGPAIAERFEETCGCDVRFVGAGDGAALLGRLRLEGARSPADIVLGLDTNLIAEAKATGLFAEHGLETPPLDLPVEWQDPVFLPYDWGYFAFVHDSERVPDPPASFEALAASDLSIVVQDPRSSTPGLGLLMWVKTAYGDRAPEIWQGLAERIVTVTPGWSEAYGMFTSGEVDMVLAYSTSPAYHLIAEDDPAKRAALFDEGHYMQVEVAAMTASTDVPDLARAFLDFMLSEGFQSVIPTTNWMYPAVVPEAGLPEGFGTLAVPEKALLLDPEAAREMRESALAEWLAAMTR
jgi:thiamine transport system substrate-binding protein